MLKKVINKIIFVIIIILCTFSLITPKTYAEDGDRHTIGGIITGADKFIDAGKDDSGTGVTGIPEENIQNMSNLLYNILFVIGIVVAVIVGITIGIKFITGSVAEKAKIKETLIPYIIGCVVLFGAFTIWKIVVTILQSSGAT